MAGAIDKIVAKFTDSMEAIEFFKGRTNVLLKKWTINLAVAGTQEVAIAGNFVYAIDATGALANVDVQFSKREDDMDKYNLVKSLGIIYPYDKVIFSWSAQAGASITLWIGNQAPDFLQVIDNRSAAASDTYLSQLVDKIVGSSTGSFNSLIDIDSGASESVLAANTNRREAIFQADSANTGIIYIGFNSTVAANKYVVALDAGDIFINDKYLGAWHAIASANDQNLSVSEV